MSKTQLSIVTICFNDVAHIEETLLSVIGQKVPGVEYLVIDGGSTDGSVELIKKHADQIDTLVSEPDQGIYDAINKGIRLAQGALIGLIHSGDTLRSGVLPVVLEKARLFPDSILYGGISTYENGEFVALVGPSSRHLDQFMIAHPGTFVPKAVYERLGCYDTSFRIAADYHAFLRFHRSGVPFVWLDLVVANFDLSGASSRYQETQKEVRRIKLEYGLIRPDSSWVKQKKKVRRVLDSLVDLFRHGKE